MTLPYVVVRANNLPLQILPDLTRSSGIEQALWELDALRAREGELRARLCEELHSLAGRSPANYRNLIDLRRRIHKGMRVDALGERHRALLGELSLDALPDWMHVLSRRDSLEAHVDALLGEEARQSREVARLLLAEGNFRHAISFARGRLQDIVSDYLESPVPEGRKRLNDEDTIWRYLMRAVTKVSPFSSFTSVGFTRLETVAPRRVIREDALVHSYGCDRASILKLLQAFTIRFLPHFAYRMTRNVQRSGDGVVNYLFVDQVERYAYRTAFARTTHTGLVGTVLQQRWCTWNEVAALLPSYADARPLVAKWLRSGYVIACPGIDDHAEDPLSKFHAIVEGVARNDPEAREVADLLADIRADLDRLQVGAIGPSGIPARIDNAFLALASRLGTHLVRKSEFTQHDTGLASLSPVSKPQIDTFAQQIEEFLHGYLGCNFRDGFGPEFEADLRAKLQPGEELGVFEFYEAAVESMRRTPSSPESRTPAMEAMLSMYDEIWRRRGEREITLSSRPLSAQAERRSFAAYGHVDDDRFVLNTIDSGFLRCFSRFFPFLGEEGARVAEACRGAYADALADACDIYDTFGFSTARRPRLCGRRVWLDHPGEDVAPAGGDVFLADLGVRWPLQAKAPQFFDRRSGREVPLRHTALFIQSIYPRIVEILLRFSTMQDPCYFAFRFGLFKLFADNAGDVPVRFPRVTYRDIVVSREQWWFPRKDLPLKEQPETEAEFLVRLFAWRRRHGIPQRVYVRRHRLSKVLDRDVSNQKKPLFIDLSSPVMLRMVARAFGSDFDVLSVEEMLPDACNDFVGDGTNRFASEIILERAVQH